MPLLPPQADLHPDDLLEPARSAERLAAGGRWVAFYTLARREKELMRRLLATGVPFYGPLVHRRLRSAGGRARSSFVPLFPGYVFSLVDDEARRRALATNTVARWLPVDDDRLLLDDLRRIRQLVASDRPLTPEARLTEGHAVRVRSGPLAGLEGTVIRRKGDMRLVVAVRFLNQGASIELEDLDLERI
jgi:transcriptional antiterminator RfaH